MIRPPRRPAEAEELWAAAEPLAPASVPPWLDPGDAALYRFAGIAADEDRDAFAWARCVVEDDGRVYAPEPSREPVFSIAAGWVESPLEADFREPSLTRDDVTDVPALYVADPFLAGERHMFLEVFDWHANKGAIGIAERDGERWRYAGVVLAEQFHLSYPLVVEDGGDWYLLPETHQAGEWRVYRARAFPAAWEQVAAPIAEAIVDATPFRSGGRWWLLASLPDSTTTRLWSSDALLDPWQEHPRSPIVEDAARARPAGRPLDLDGRLIRLAQDCSSEYGAAVRAFEIVTLDEADYQERELPGPVLEGSGRGWNAGGMHHLDAVRARDGRWLVAVDGWKRPVPAW